MQNMSRNELMRQIMRYDFAVNELVLFLDTHPTDMKALKKYEEVVCKAKKLKELYNETFGPITTDDVKSTESWTWLKGPWPWEKQQGGVN